MTSSNRTTISIQQTVVDARADNIANKYTWTQNQCTQAYQYGLTVSDLEDMALCLQRQYHRTIWDTKKQFWKEFLDNANNI